MADNKPQMSAALTAKITRRSATASISVSCGTRWSPDVTKLSRI